MIFDDGDLDEDLDASWSLWVTSNHRVELQHLNGTLKSLVEHLNDRWSSFVTHSYVTRQQREYIKSLRSLSGPTTFALINCDFAENFTFVNQQEIQSAYWSQRQATLYTIVINIGNDHRNIVVISDRMVHDTSFVYCTQEIIVAFIRNEYPTVTKFNYVRYNIKL